MLGGFRHATGTLSHISLGGSKKLRKYTSNPHKPFNHASDPRHEKKSESPVPQNRGMADSGRTGSLIPVRHVILRRTL